MYYRWEFPDERPTEIVEGANQEKMYTDYSYAAQDGGNIKRKVKIGALAITAILIVGAIAAVPAVLLTLPKFKHAKNTVAVESKTSQPSTVISRDSALPSMSAGMNVLRHDNLTVVNRSARQVVEQTVNIENYIERPTQCKNGEYDGDEEHVEHETFEKSQSAMVEHTSDQTGQTPLGSNVQVMSESTNVTGAPTKPLSNNSDIDEKFSHALRIIANFQMAKSGLDSKIADTGEQPLKASSVQDCPAYPPGHEVQQNKTFVNLTELQQPRVVIVFYNKGEGKKRVNAVDFGEQFLQFIKQSETGEWNFDISKLIAKAEEAMKPIINMNVSFHNMSAHNDLETSTGGSNESNTELSASNMSDSVSANINDPIPDQMNNAAPVNVSESTLVNMGESAPVDMGESAPVNAGESAPVNMGESAPANITNQQGQADQIVQMLLLNRPFTWILSTKDSDNNYNYFASGPLNVSSVDLVTASLLSGMDSDNLETLVNTLVEKISLVANLGN